MDWPTTLLSVMKDIVTIIGVVIASFVGVSGLSAWKKQLRGKTDYEVARRCLKSVYKLREAVKYVRNPYISVGEMEKSLKESGLDESKDLTENQKRNWAVYDARWKKVTEAKTEMDIEFFEAEVSWGPDVLLKQKDLNDLIGRLYATVAMFLKGYGKEKTDEVIYDNGEEDKFSKEVNQAIEQIENYLKTYLK